MAVWFLFQEAVVLVFFCGISYCEKDLLENLILKRDDPPELTDFLQSVLKKKDEFEKIRIAAKEILPFSKPSSEVFLNERKYKPSDDLAGSITHSPLRIKKLHKHKVYANKHKRRFSKRYLQERPVNDVYPYMFDDPEAGLEQDERAERSPWNEVTDKSNGDYTVDKTGTIRFRRGLDLNDYNSENDEEKSNIEVYPRSRSGVRNVPGNKYEHRRGAPVNIRNRIQRKRQQDPEEHDYLGLKKQCEDRDRETKDDFYPSEQSHTCVDELDYPINIFTEKKVTMEAKKLLYGKDSIEKDVTRNEESDSPDDASNRSKRSMKLNILDDNNLIKSVKHDSSSNSLILTLKIKETKAKGTTSKPTKSHSKSPGKDTLGKPKTVNVFNIVPAVQSTNTKRKIKLQNQNKIVFPNEMAILYQVDQAENTDNNDPAKDPSQKRITLEDVDEPTSAIEQHHLSTKPYVIPTSPVSESTMEILRFRFADVVTTPDSDKVEGQFLVKDKSDMVHGRIKGKFRNLDKRTSMAKTRMKNFLRIQPIVNKRFSRATYDDYDYIDISKDHSRNIRKPLYDRNFNFESQLDADMSEINRNNRYRKNVLQDYQYEEQPEIENRYFFNNRKLLAFSENEANISANDKYGEMDYENGRYYAINENKIRVKRSIANLLNEQDDDYSEDLIDDYSPLYRKRSDDYAYEEEGDSAVGETQTYRAKKDDRSRAYDSTFFKARSDNDEFTFGDTFKSISATPVIFNYDNKGDANTHNKFKTLTKIIHDKINKKSNTPTNINNFKRMVAKCSGQNYDCHGKKCKNCDKHCKHCGKKEVNDKLKEDNNIDRPDILKKIENLSSKLELLNNEQEYWKKCQNEDNVREREGFDRSRSAGEQFNPKPPSSSNIIHLNATINNTAVKHDGNNNTTKNVDTTTDNNINSTSNSALENVTIETTEHFQIENITTKVTCNPKVNGTACPPTSTQIVHTVTKKPSNETQTVITTTNETKQPLKQKIREGGYYTSNFINGPPRFESEENPFLAKRKFRKYYENLLRNPENSINPEPIEADSSEVVGFAHHPVRCKPKYNTSDNRSQKLKTEESNTHKFSRNHATGEDRIASETLVHEEETLATSKNGREHSVHEGALHGKDKAMHEGVTPLGKEEDIHEEEALREKEQNMLEEETLQGKEKRIYEGEALHERGQEMHDEKALHERGQNIREGEALDGRGQNMYEEETLHEGGQNMHEEEALRGRGQNMHGGEALYEKEKNMHEKEALHGRGQNMHGGEALYEKEKSMHEEEALHGRGQTLPEWRALNGREQNMHDGETLHGRGQYMQYGKALHGKEQNIHKGGAILNGPLRKYGMNEGNALANRQYGKEHKTLEEHPSTNTRHSNKVHRMHGEQINTNRPHKAERKMHEGKILTNNQHARVHKMHEGVILVNRQHEAEHNTHKEEIYLNKQNEDREKLNFPIKENLKEEYIDRQHETRNRKVSPDRNQELNKQYLTSKGEMFPNKLHTSHEEPPQKRREEKKVQITPHLHEAGNKEMSPDIVHVQNEKIAPTQKDVVAPKILHIVRKEKSSQNNMIHAKPRRTLDFSELTNDLYSLKDDELEDSLQNSEVDDYFDGINDILNEGQSKQVLDPETNEDEGLAEFAVSTVRFKNNTAKLHKDRLQSPSTNKINPKSVGHRHNKNNKNKQQTNKKKNGNIKNKLEHREARSLLRSQLDTVDSFKDIVEEAGNIKRISKRDADEPTGFKKSMQELQMRTNSENYAETASESIIQAPFEEFSKLNGGYWRINSVNNFKHVRGRKSHFANKKLQKRRNALRRNYYNRFLDKRHLPKGYSVNRSRRHAFPKQLSTVHKTNPENTEPKHKNKNKKPHKSPPHKEANKDKPKSWISTKNRENCNTNNLFGKDMYVNSNLADKINIARSNPSDESEAQVGTKDYGQLQEALNGHLASLIVSNVFKKVKECQQLHHRFSHGLYRKHGYKSEMQNLDAYRNNEAEGDVKHTEEMLHQIMKVLNKIILDQVRRRTCKHLPPELQKYLTTLTKPSSSVRSEIDDESKVSEEGAPLPLIKSGKKIDKPVDTEQGGFLFHNPSNINRLEQDEIAIKKKMKMIRNLLDKYKHMSTECKVKVGDVEAYLKKHLNLLRRMLKEIKKQQIVENKPRDKFPVPNKVKRKHYDQPPPAYNPIQEQNLINNQLYNMKLGSNRPFKPHINIDKLVEDNLNKVKMKEYEKNVPRSNSKETLNSKGTSKSKYKNEDESLNIDEDYENPKSEHKREVGETENENKPKVSEKYKRLIQAAESIRKKRENEDRLGKLFGKIEKKSIKNEEDGMKLFDKDGQDFSHARFETPVVFSLKK